MIISSLIGGLGNQMFQCAYGLIRSRAYHQPLYLDLTYFASDPKRSYSLQCFPHLRASLLPDWSAFPLASRLRLKFIQVTAQQFGGFEDEVLSSPPIRSSRMILPLHYYLVYAQDYHLFESERRWLLRQFEFKPFSDAVDLQLSRQIRQTTGVALHIRRGDYVSDPQANRIHGLVDFKYYLESMDFIRSRVVEPHFFVFSDDLLWAKSKLGKLANVTFIESESDSPVWRDMQLMTYCQHHILANSTYSWWPAWLNQSPKKIVIAPKQWFADSTKQNNLIPREWISI